MKDLTIILDDYKLNIRAAAIIIHNNKLLTHKNINEDFYGLVGGRIHIGENSAKTINREIYEEMGKRIEIQEYLTTIENFFQGEDKKYHEIMFVYRAEFTDEEDKKITETIHNIEGEDELSYEWIDIDRLDEIPLKPDIIKNMIKDNRFIKHHISDDFLNQYYDNTENNNPCKNVEKFIEMNIKPSNAIDIGCGAGRDTKYLIKNGWKVTAIDKNDVKERILKYLDEEEKTRFEFKKENFEKISIDKNLLVVANNSLSFCSKDNFYDMWKKITESITQGGYFVGNIFGDRDEWRNLKKMCTFLTKEETLNLFEDFDIVYFEEVEKDGITGEGKTKHWHFFDVIAKKK